jgi:hypothetical protein
MAKDKVTVDVNVDDKGTTKKVGLSAKETAGSLDNMGRSAQTTDRRLKGAAQTSANSTKNNAKMMQSISGGLVPAYATLAANIFALTAAFNFFKRAADVSNLQKSQTSFAASTGVAMRTLTNRLQEASGGMLGFKEAAKATAIGVAKGFSGKQMEDLAIGAKKASAALGVGFEDAFDRLVRGASKAEPELLDELGITLRLEAATKRYGEAIGKKAKDLTTFERSQAVLLETQRQLDEQFGSAAAPDNQFVKLQKTFEEIVRQITDTFLPAFNQLAGFLASNAKAAAAVFGLIALSIVASIPGVQELAQKVTAFGEGSSASLGDAIDDWRKYRAELENTSKTLEEIRQKATKKTVGIAKQLVDSGNKSKIVGKLAKGEDLSKRDKNQLQKALDKAEKQYKKHGEVVSGIFKGEDIKRFKHFKSSFEQMNRQTKTSGQKFKDFIGIMKRGAKIGGKAIKAGIVAPYRLAAKAARGAARAVSMVGKATVMLAVVATILKGLQTLSEAPATAVNNFISMVSSIAQSLQWALNTIANGINSLATKLPDWVKEMLGIDKGAKLITPFTFGDDAQAQLEKIADGLFPMQKWAKQEEETKKLKTINEGVQEISENAVTAGKDLKDALAGIELTDNAAKKAVIRATALSTLAISDQIRDAIDSQYNKQQQEQNLENIIKGMDEAQLEVLAPGIVKAIRERNLKEIDRLQISAADFVAKTLSFKDVMKNLSQVQGKTAEQRLEFLESIVKQGTELIKTGEATGQATEAQEKMNAVFENRGGLEAYTEALRTHVEKLRDIKLEIQAIQLMQKENEASYMPKGFTKFLNDQSSIRIAEKKHQENLLRLAELKTNLEKFKDEEYSDPNLTEDDARAAFDKQKNLTDLTATALDQTKKDLSFIGRATTVVSDTMYEGFTNAFDGLIQGTLDAKQAFASMAKSILSAISRIIAEMLVARAVSSFMGGFMPGGGTGVDVPAGGISSMGSGTQLRYGGVVQPPRRSYADGGIAQGRDSGYTAVLHGTEAVVPIGQNKHIPVEMVGGSSGTQNNVSISVTMDNSGNKSESSSDSMMGENLGQAISMAVQEELQYQKRSGGILNPYGVA